MPASATNCQFDNTRLCVHASGQNVIPIASSIAPIPKAGVKSSIKGTSPSAPGKEAPPSWWAPPSTPAPFFHTWDIMPLGVDLQQQSLPHANLPTAVVHVMAGVFGTSAGELPT